MNLLEKAPPRVRESGAVLDQLALHAIVLPKRGELEAYLELHPELACLLGEMCTKVRAAFGPAAELSLELYIDPEIDDRYLTLYVRQEAYAPDFIERIDAACAEFHAPLEAVPGYFLVTTDFRRLRGADGL